MLNAMIEREWKAHRAQSGAGLTLLRGCKRTQGGCITKSMPPRTSAMGRDKKPGREKNTNKGLLGSPVGLQS